jgi:hypothetical protein
MAIDVLLNVLTTLVQDLSVWQAMAVGPVCYCPDPVNNPGGCIGDLIYAITHTTVPPLGPINVLPCPP